MTKVLIAGEGRLELGGFAVEPVYRPDRPDYGLIEALLRSVIARDFQIANGVRWKDVPKYKFGRSPAKAEAQTIAGLSQLAKDSEYDVVVFLRDRDGKTEREKQIRQAVEEAALRYEGVLQVVGDVAVECADAWVLAWTGESRTQELSVTKAKTLREKRARTTEETVALISSIGNDAIAIDALVLRRWIAAARAAFSADAAPTGAATDA